MEPARSDIARTAPESEIVDELLALDGRDILELGCGAAELTRALATGGRDRRIVATEVDEIQHAKNLAIDDLPNVRFERAGAEAIPAPDAAFDVAFMFKSLHHVPVERMDDAMREIARVLRPGGRAYISEPVYAGAFNDILRMFHDEEEVRKAAFEALRCAVEAGPLALERELFFNAPLAFADFDEFEEKVLRVTHSDHRLSDELHARVRERFAEHAGPDGAHFLMPIRVDLLQKGEGSATAQ